MCCGSTLQRTNAVIIFTTVMSVSVVCKRTMLFLCRPLMLALLLPLPPPPADFILRSSSLSFFSSALKSAFFSRNSTSTPVIPRVNPILVSRMLNNIGCVRTTDPKDIGSARSERSLYVTTPASSTSPVPWTSSVAEAFMNAYFMYLSEANWMCSEGGPVARSSSGDGPCSKYALNSASIFRPTSIVLPSMPRGSYVGVILFSKAKSSPHLPHTSTLCAAQIGVPALDQPRCAACAC
mmetsp:Transcript_13588/g.32574  ORF Transcript_13588/g.32574 Transcript_13588/m.32574 type:complete len:237 (+) Transcript_13588:1523-2233(+)